MAPMPDDSSARRGERDQPRMLSSPTSGLPEALAALNLQHSCPDDSNETEKSASISQTSDSGYSSAGATPLTATPEYLRTPEASQTFPRDGRRMSFAAIARTPTLKVFERPIPNSIQNRFDDLNELFSRALLDHLQKAKIDASGPRTISIKLKYLGQNEESAKPCVLILCSKEASRKVKQFFNTKAVKSQYQPDEPSIGLPHLEVKVYDRPPRPIGLIGSIPSNQSSHFQNSVAYPAVCGQSLRLSEDGANHFGTLGGLVMITSYSGSTSMFGMSAGHIVPEEDQDSSAHPRFGLRSPLERWTIDSILEGSEQNSAEFEDDDDDASFSDSESIKLSFDGESHRAESPKPTQKLSRLVELPEVPWSAVGPLWKTSTSPHWTTHQNNLDWLLISIDNPLLYDPNLFQGNQTRVEVKEAYSHKLVSLKQDRQVMVFCGISGRKAGILSRTMSCLALGTGKTFVKTYDLKILGGMVLQEGDCGAWVLDILTSAVYGHVVASDDFGEVYVVPLSDTFEDIMIKSSVFSVCVPTIKDIRTWYGQTTTQKKRYGVVEEGNLKKDSDSVYVRPPVQYERSPMVKKHPTRYAPPQRYINPAKAPSRRFSASYASSISDSGYSSMHTSSVGSVLSFHPPPSPPLEFSRREI